MLLWVNCICHQEFDTKHLKSLVYMNGTHTVGHEVKVKIKQQTHCVLSVEETGNSEEAVRVGTAVFGLPLSVYVL